MKPYENLAGYMDELQDGVLAPIKNGSQRAIVQNLLNVTEEMQN